MQNFNAMTVIVSGTYGGDNLCQNCADGASIDDSISEFYQGLTEYGEPTLRHKSEGKGSVRLPSIIKWTDTLPDYPDMESSATVGCQLCGLVRGALLRRGLSGRAAVDILCAYVWDGNGDKFDVENEHDEGLVYMRCEVFGTEPKIQRLAYIVFLVETEDGRYRTEDT